MAKIPPGTRLMDEYERQMTLRDLDAAMKATMKELERFEVIVRTMRTSEYKKELESKLSRIERAIETFSKPKVFVSL